MTIRTFDLDRRSPGSRWIQRIIAENHLPGIQRPANLHHRRARQQHLGLNPETPINFHAIVARKRQQTIRTQRFMNGLRHAFANPVQIGRNSGIDIEKRQHGHGICTPGTRSDGQQDEDNGTEEQLI